MLAADGGCVALVVDPAGAGPCRDGQGVVVHAGAPRAVMVHGVVGSAPLQRMPSHGCEVDRIRDHPTMGKAPSHTDRTRMVSLCPGHHRGVGAQAGYVWATAHRDDLRLYLQARNSMLGWS